ncbi:MAG: outer membrane lipid asymmetry maintenance protein MlaD [Proteobacteria bacterium]|nr:outer membrane lipid asymmetry maintenance protein MlaD [Pseudomonadota bacterium]MBU1736773.1 outer membrane lipid asymmetry maintenance protein MlaD [Pseudomonadota bacterium]
MKKISVEISVGLFMIAGFLCFVYLSVQLGEFSIFAREKSYTLSAEFDSISGLKTGAVLEIAGVNIGRIASIDLGENDRARVTMKIGEDVRITEDAIASVRTMGIIGDKYIRIIQGGSEDHLKDGDVISETESAIDLEELVSKYIFGDV